MAETFRYLLGDHGVFEGTPEDVLARGFDPWQAQLFTEATNPMQFGDDARFTWSGYGLPGGQELGLDYATGYVPTLLDLRAAVTAGTATAQERQQYDQMVRQAQAIPLRDWSTLTYNAGTSGTGQTLSGASPDLGGILLRIADRIDQGTATAQERDLFRTTEQALRLQDWTASVPQPSDAFNPLGDQFFQALNMLSLAAGGAGSFGAFGAAAGAGAGAGAGASVLGIPTSTLAQVGTLSGLGAMGTGMLGTALQQPWLQKLAMGLGVVGGLAGGTAGIANATQGGIQNLGEAARLVQGASRVTGALGSASGVDALQRAAGYLRMTGQAGDVVSGAWNPDFTSTTPGGNMEWDWNAYSDPIGPGLGWDAGGYPAMDYSAPIGPGLGWDAGGYPTGSSSSGGWLGGLSGLLGAIKPFLGPAMQGLGSLVTGAQGASAAREAAGAQSEALNRAIALQEAQWLMQQANQAPWLAHGQEALHHLGGIAMMGQPAGFQGPGALQAGNYAFQSPGMTWSPQSYGGYTPTAIPSAEGYRWTPGQVPRAADYRYTPGAVPTLSGKELLANDPGVQLRLDEGRRALEASALARGTGLSGPALAALQRQGQELSSQEYGQAWQRASQQAQWREQWNQVASQMGWSQAEAETRWREMLAQQSTAHNWGQALQEANARAEQQQFGWNAGFQAQQQGQREAQAYGQELYQRALGENQLRYGRDLAQNQTDYDRALTSWNAQNQDQNTLWNRWASLAGLGQTAQGQLGTQGAYNAAQIGSLLGQLGSAQGIGTLGATANLHQGITGGINSLTSLLGRLNA